MSRKFAHPSLYASALPLFVDVIDPQTDVGKPPVVMVHGGAHTGACYLRTIDGRPGWAMRFATAGYPVVLPDWPGVGRSGAVLLRDLCGDYVCRLLQAFIESLSEPVILLTHSMSGPYGWVLAERLGERVRGLIAVAPGQPGNIQKPGTVLNRNGDDVAVAMEAMPLRFNLNERVSVGVEFVERKLLGASTQFPRHLVKSYAASLHSLPPRLLYERLNIEGSQLRVERPSQLSGCHILVVTGEHDSEHSRALDSAIVDWLRTQGAIADFIFLPDVGERGNGHMLMLENNSDAVAKILIGWADELR